MSNPATPSDHSLEHFRSYLYVLARAHVGPKLQQEIDASDLVQQTLLDAHAKRRQFRGATRAQRAAWLRQILANNLTDALRHRHREKRDVSRHQRLEEAIDESFCRAESWLAASQTSPSQCVVRNEQLLLLAAALTELPEPQREAVILRHLHGMTLADIAEQLGRPETAVAGLVYRALNKLRVLLDDRRSHRD